MHFSAQRKRGGAGASTSVCPVTCTFALSGAVEFVPTKIVNDPGSTTRRMDLS
jgi:hypothetical protein